MSRIVARTRPPLQLLSGTFGVLLLAYLVHRAGTAKLLESIFTLGWGLSLVIALGGFSHLLKTWAWRLTLLDEKCKVSFVRMLGLRLGSEAIGQLGVLGQMLGENLRVSLLSSTIPLDSGIASVTLDRALFVLSAAVVSTVGLVTVLVFWPLPHTLSLYTVLLASILLGVILVAALAVRNRWAVLSGSAHIVGRVRYFSGWMERRRSLIHSVEQKLLDFCHYTPGTFWGSFALNLACHGAAVFEVYLILCLLDTKINIIVALAIEGLTKLVNLLGIFNPGNIGTYEGGNMLIARLFGISGAVGLTLGLTRRARSIFWATVGSFCLVMLSRSRRRDSDDVTHVPIQVPKGPTSSPEAQNMSALVGPGRGHVAVILAYNLNCYSSCGSRLPQVGALPVLLRAILGAQKAGAARIVVAHGHHCQSTSVFRKMALSLHTYRTALQELPCQ